MSTNAVRYNEGKPRLSYLLEAPLAIEGLARRFEAGASKYPRNNWKKGLPDDEIIDALMRHLTAYINGETEDPEGYHADAILWNALVLSEQFHQRRKNG